MDPELSRVDQIKGTLLFSNLRLREKNASTRKTNPAAALRIIPGWVWGGESQPTEVRFTQTAPQPRVRGGDLFCVV